MLIESYLCVLGKFSIDQDAISTEIAGKARMSRVSSQGGLDKVGQAKLGWAGLDWTELQARKMSKKTE